MKVLLGCEGKEHKVILKVLCNWLRRVDPSLPNVDLRLREFRGDEIWSDNKFIEFVGGARNREDWTKVILVFDDNQRDKVAQKARTLQSTDLPGIPICVLFIVPHMHGWVRRMLNPSDGAELDQRPGGQKVKNMTWAAECLGTYASIQDPTSLLQKLRKALQCQCDPGHRFPNDFRGSPPSRRSRKRR
jgi:hypothetical protein